MEHTLIRPHRITLKQHGIPYHLIAGLISKNRFSDVNLISGYGPDNDVEEINRMESRLGSLSRQQIDARVAADCCCIWRYDYPQRIHDICAIIGGSSHTALRLHYQIGPERRRDFIDYDRALQGWLIEKAPDDIKYFRLGSEETTHKIYQLLGQWDPLKKLLVERTSIGLARRVLNCSFLGFNDHDQETALYPYHTRQLPPDRHERMTSLEHTIMKEMGSAAGDFLCDVGGSAEPACHFKFIRRLDILTSSIGCLRWRGNLPAKDGSIKGRRQLTRRYLDTLETYRQAGNDSYLNTAGNGLQQELFDLLGKPTDFKRWLVAGLWKNIKNQTSYQAYPMKNWVEFVRIGENYLHGLESSTPCHNCEN